MRKQLFEKESNSYKPIYPLVRLEDIIDTISDKSIQWILNNYNHIYVEYSESVAVTRNKVPQLLRRTGIWISYNAGTEVVTEYYKGDNKDVTNFIKWTNDDNWERFDKIKHLDGSITYQHLSESLRQLIGQGNNITNFPDDEDLEVKDGLLKLKDRDFEPNNFSGLGRVILRKNIKAVDGHPKNVLTQDMINKENTIYEIRYDFDLNGGEITIPEGCVLDFQGGSINNGTIRLSSGSNVFFNGATVNNCCLDLSFAIVQDVIIQGGTIKISGDRTGILLGNEEKGYYAQDVKIKDLWIEGDTDNSSFGNINKCKGIVVRNSWINYIHNVKIQHCGTAVTIIKANDIKFSQCTLRWNGLHINHISGESNTFQNGDIEQGFNIINIEKGGLAILNSYIEAHTSGRGININGGELIINDSYLLTVFIAVHGSCSLIAKNNKFNYLGLSSYQWNGITILDDINLNIVLEHNRIVEDSACFIRTDANLKLAYYKDGEFKPLTNCEFSLNQTNININTWLGSVEYNSATMHKFNKFVSIGDYNRITKAITYPADEDSSPNGSLIFSGQRNNKHSVFYKTEDGDIISLGSAFGTKASIQSYQKLKSGLYIATDTKELLFWEGTNWFPLVTNYTAFGSRPINPSKGAMYFDTTLNKPIWWTGSKWVDATGADV